MLTQNGRYDVNPAIVVEIAERGAASGKQRLSPRVGLLKMTVMVQGKQCRLKVMQGRVDLFHIVENMTLRDEEVLEPVIIEILQADTPAGGHAGHHGQAGL